MKSDSEFKALFIRLVSTAESLRDQINTNRLQDAEGLYYSFAGHAWAIYYLSRGTPIPTEQNLVIYYPGSINVLCRAAIECYLAFYYVFIESNEPTMNALRYDIWVRQGHMIRTNYKPILKDSLKTINEDKKLVQELLKRIENNAEFKKLPNSKQKEILKGRDWRIPEKMDDNGWRRPSYADIAIRAGIPEDIAPTLYGFLSGYAHPSSLSVLQLRSAQTEKDIELISSSAIGTIKILMQMMIARMQELCAPDISY